jgi:AcrR family transcriptional regulator
MPATRRERLRTATIDEIKGAALDQIARRGAGALTVRGIARAIGMSPAGIYRYYEGLDALITELIADAYNNLADHVQAAADQPGTTRERMRGAMLAYREWCVQHRNRFLLIFGTPIPGYAAPDGGPTTAANQRIGQAFFAIGAEAWRRGELALPQAPRPLEPAEREFAEGVTPGFPAELVGSFLSTWAHFHGMVTLEVLGQLHWIYPDPDTFYSGEVERILNGQFGTI